MKVEQSSNKKNRDAAFAGRFYPGNKKELNQQLKHFFENACDKKEDSNHLQALISPHAGYIFSGQVAASAYNQIPENTSYKRIFVLASSHQYSFNGAAVYNRGNYTTPLGEITVDIKLANQLIQSSPLFLEKNEVHEFEHSLEVQLPFLQYKLKNNILLVPIILGTNSKNNCKELAQLLKPWFTPDNLFIISTDFSHYPEYAKANTIDLHTAQAICTNKAQRLVEVLEENKKQNIRNLATSLCGWTSVLTLLYLTEKENFIYEKIDYKNSGDETTYGDKIKVVGYWAIAVYNESETFIISKQEQNILLKKARSSISNFLRTGKKGKISTIDSFGILNETAGVFVSIYVNNNLRGCIGGFAQEKTLNEMVQSMSVSAARDRRFETLTTNELGNMKLEISVLTPLKKIKSKKEIELGKHGIFIKKGLNTGTFLPQVATKTGWNLDEFLGRCSRDKAGLGWNGWQTAELYTYEAFIFKE